MNWYKNTYLDRYFITFSNILIVPNIILYTFKKNLIALKYLKISPDILKIVLKIMI